MIPLRRHKYLTLALSIVLLSAVIAVAGGTLDHLSLFMQIRSKIDELYVQEVDLPRMDGGALKGMISELDLYNALIDINETYPYQPPDKIQGQLGLELGCQDNAIMVVSVFPHSPAAQVGITSGDRLMAIGQHEFYADKYSVFAATKTNYGVPGSEIECTLFREGRNNFDEVKMTYQRVPQPEAIKVHYPEKETAVVAVRRLGDDTDFENTVKMLQTALRTKPKHLVLDLRNCSIGAIEYGVRLADFFIKDGEVLGYIVGRKEMNAREYKQRTGIEKKWRGSRPVEFTETFTANDNNKLPRKVKLGVLINHGTAEAGEVCAAVLKHVGEFPIYGEKSFGKVTSFSEIPLKPDFQRKILIMSATFYLPNDETTEAMMTEKEKEPAGIEESSEAEDAPQKEKNDKHGPMIHGKGIKPDTEIKSIVPELISSKDKEDVSKTLVDILTGTQKEDLSEDKQLKEMLNAMKT